MYEVLIAHLRECAKLDPSNNTYAEAAEAIEELQATVEGYESSTNMALVEIDGETIIEFVPKWIPVSERLPVEFENVLVANKRGKHYDIDKAWWNGSFFDRCAKGGYHNITHWMPLPQPPKEGE
jgi:hypothetical protein